MLKCPGCGGQCEVRDDDRCAGQRVPVQEVTVRQRGAGDSVYLQHGQHSVWFT